MNFSGFSLTLFPSWRPSGIKIWPWNSQNPYFIYIICRLVVIYTSHRGLMTIRVIPHKRFMAVRERWLLFQTPTPYFARAMNCHAVITASV